MTETTVVTDQAGVQRTADGTLTDQTQTQQTGQSSQNTSQETKTDSTQATDGKTLLTEGKKEETKTETKTETKSGAPEKYSDYTVPDGFTLDPAVKTEADTLFKGLGLSQESAQKLVDFYTAKTVEAANAPYRVYQEMTDNWRKESEAHPDLAGKIGAGKEISVRIAKFLDGIGDPKLASDFREAMDTSGIGNYHAFIRVLNHAASRLTEGTHVAGNGPSKAGQSAPGQAPPSAAAALWPTLPSANKPAG